MTNILLWLFLEVNEKRQHIDVKHAARNLLRQEAAAAQP